MQKEGLDVWESERRNRIKAEFIRLGYLSQNGLFLNDKQKTTNPPWLFPDTEQLTPNTRLKKVRN